MFLPISAQGAPERVFELDDVLLVEEGNVLRQPVAVASSAVDEIVVADAHESRLVVFRRSSDGWSVTQLIRLDNSPQALVHDGKQYVVSLREKGGLYALDGARLQLRRIGLPDQVTPGALAPVPGGGLLVYDYASGEVLRLDDQRKLISRHAIDRQVVGMCAHPNGGFFATIGDRAELRLFDAQGQELERWVIPGVGPVPAWPGGIVVTPDGTPILADRHNNRLLVLDSAGVVTGIGSRSGWEQGLMRFPADLTRLADGRVAVADLGNGRVQLFRYFGEGTTP